ncbi:hypothetical protein SAMN04487957_10554 [Halomonas shengliensis]|uniref:Uncharacterized protein n=1 Tax=Halomonas shengliensis TaxID=419597 RepID=A0A1H0IB62_9GAMM|nr:hypothetical protein [Halomonas shengliensis]SDO28648.1 hypothetical protein SAMN04487957_10554 [Halomonas shengliensis]
MTIDPEKLLQLARQRQHDGGVTLGWPTMLKIIDQLHILQSQVAHLQMVEEATIPCRFHDHDTEACLKYSGRVPCEPRPDEVEVQTVVGTEGSQ